MSPDDRILSISDLRRQPALRDVVTDRIWNAWWRTKGIPLAVIARRVEETLAADGLPLALVAHRGEQFLGTASVIASDMPERPLYTPWVAAVWVEPEHRTRGIGAALVRAAAEAAFARGFDPVYLCATPANSPFYRRLGWRQVEADIAGLNLFSASPGQLHAPAGVSAV
ncbi:GNAT family N-acetyltransferase [Chelatococcus reniformis]|uniref:N-acetyltransferase n=1 Tax=Chelatococcus reniformis TaxID=1494448 RepID=A0A916U6A0_9HYPH|nr:GNAT family N-acetyltransferase [Chelatococcus reniformis]GGC61455.1 N-acetyltransferase [Chelatococcus reniformis]